MTNQSALERIDSFPYRHRVAEVMSAPLVTIRPQANLAEACRAMADGGVSSLVVVAENGRPSGIVTERDVLRSVADHRHQAPDMTVSAVMSGPVATVRHDAFLYVAMGRMARLKLRHLVAEDADGRAVGMVTVRGLLHLRAGAALAFGDEIAAASEPEEMAAVEKRLPGLAGDLLAEGVDGLGVAAVASSVLRDMTVRAARIAESAMRAEGWGEAPAPWCVLLLGSGGRRESLFRPDQDNALIHAGRATDDLWFAELGRRLCAFLDAAGVPLCKGGVMATNPQWRRNTADWRAEIDRWVREADGPELLNVDIFVDFRPIHGDYALAAAVREHLVRQAAGAPRFLHAMAGAIADMATPLGVLGQLKTREGRLDIKMGGLLPLVSAVRLLALKHRIPDTGTGERLRALGAGRFLPEADMHACLTAHEVMVRLLLEQQVADAQAGIALSNSLDPRRLTKEGIRRLKAALQATDALKWFLRNALSAV